MGNRVSIKTKEIDPPDPKGRRAPRPEALEIGIPWDVLEEHVMQFLEPRDINIFHAIMRKPVEERTKKMVLDRFEIKDDEDWMLRYRVEQILRSEDSSSERMISIITLGCQLPDSRLDMKIKRDKILEQRIVLLIRNHLENRSRVLKETRILSPVRSSSNIYESYLEYKKIFEKQTTEQGRRKMMLRQIHEYLDNDF